MMRLYSLATILLFQLQVIAQQHVFEIISTHDGLSQNDINHIYQDSRGYMWFGTNDGLNRYDGYDFKIYRPSESQNSIAENIISHISEDDKANLWIGTPNQGISILNTSNETFETIRNTSEKPKILTSNSINYIAPDRHNNMWAISSYGFNHISLQEDNSYKVRSFEIRIDINTDKQSGGLNSIFFDSKDRIWLIGIEGIALITVDSLGIPTGSIEILKGLEFYSDFKTMAEWEDGYLLSHHEGVLYFDFDAKSNAISNLFSMGDNVTSNMIITPDKALWMGGYYGLTRFEVNPDKKGMFIETNYFRAADGFFDLINESIRSLFVDNTGILWIGTNGGGIAKYNSRKRQFRHYKKTINKSSLSHNKVTSITEDNQGNIWIGTEGGGLNLLPQEQSKNYKTGFQHFDVNSQKQQNFVYDILDYENINTPTLLLNIGYDSKIALIEKKNNQWLITRGLDLLDAQGYTNSSIKDENGMLWIGAYNGGLHRYKLESGTKVPERFHPDNSNILSITIRSILEDSKGRIWIGTAAGLSMITREEKSKSTPNFINFLNNPADTTSLSFNYILPLLESSKGEIWIGTFGGGLNKYIEGTEEANGHFQRINTNHGLPNNVIKEILEDDDGWLWIATNRGLSRYNSLSGEIRNYDTYDGLQSLEFGERAGCKLRDGELLFGGVNGFNAFYPDEITEDTVQPKIVLTDLQIFANSIDIGEEINGNVLLTKSLNLTKEITLKHSENNFTIKFAALHYAVPKNNQYWYMLEGYDKSWIRTSSLSRFAKYNNLKPGTYIFKIQAANSDGYKVKEPRRITIHIKPPFWNTFLFRLGTVIILISAIILIFYIRIEQIRSKNVELEKEVTVRTKEIREKNKILENQAKALGETNYALEERQSRIAEQTKQLVVQRDELFELNAVKDKLFTIVAHDLKNPFNTLGGFLELLFKNYDQYPDGTKRELLGHAHNSSKKIETLLLNLLNWARSQSGGINFEPKRINLVELIKNNISLVQDQAVKKQIEIDFSIDQDTVLLNLDINLIDTVLRNLLSNAIKFTSSGGHIKVYLEIKKEGIDLIVRDNGVGISNKDIQKLFRKDLHHSTPGTDEEGGTGLGLVTCKDFMEMHGGSIAVTSKENEGSSFILTFPR